MEEDLDIVVCLKEKPFGSLPFDRKLLIVQKGRPCPPLKNLTCSVKERGRTYNRHFTESTYELYKWLCGSEVLSKLFCWPCLLFSNHTNVWNSTGYDNLNGISRSAKSHEKSESHLHNIVSLYNFGKQRIDESLDRSLQVNNSLHNQKVKKIGTF